MYWLITDLQINSSKIQFSVIMEKPVKFALVHFRVASIEHDKF